MSPHVCPPASRLARYFTAVSFLRFFWCVVFAVAPIGAAAAEATPTPALVPTTMLAAPDDFEVTVWAQAPQLRNPTNIDIDAAGRIWVAEGVNYRRHESRDKSGDRIMVLTDTDGDGRADRSDVFVQEPWLIAPLGIAIIDNKVIVSNAPDLIIYTDVDRNLRFDPAVDKREVLLTGFNGRNHDHALHAVTFGPDGWWYLNQGNSGAHVTDRSGRTFRVGSEYDPTYSGATPLFGWRPIDFSGARSDDGHVYVGGFAMRIQPDGTNLEVIGYNFRNSYEQTVTSFGDVFQNDNDDTPSCRTTFMLEYGSFGFFSRDGKRTWQADRRPGQSIPISQWRQEDPGVVPFGDMYGAGAPTGIAFNEGLALGESWRGLLLSCEAARNTVFGYRPVADGAGFKLERFDFLTSNPEGVLAGIDSLRGKTSSELKTFFRPSDVAIGPDGAVYVADWFDPRVGGHADHDEGTTGAIYRVAPKGFRSARPQFDLTTTAGQIAALANPAVNVRALGFEKLRAAGTAAIPAMAALLSDANPYLRARAVWLLAQLGPDGHARVEQLLADADPQMRIVAFRALRRIQHRVLEHATKLAGDSSPAVRREVAVALRDFPWEKSGPVLLTLARAYDGKDRTYLEAWGIGCTGKEDAAYTALAAQPPAPEIFAQLVWRLTPAGAVPHFVARAEKKDLPERERLAAVTALGFIPTRDAARALLDLAQRGEGLVKAHALWWLLNYRTTRWSEFGVDAELKSRGLYDPATVAVAPSLVPEPELTQLPPATEIAKLAGDAPRGTDKAQSCLLCHRIGDRGVDYGPEITTWAKRQSVEATILAIVDPSAEIAHGFEGTTVTLKDGTVVQGILDSGSDPLVIRSMGGLQQLIPADRVQSRERLRRSLMLNAEQLGFSAQDVADIVAYLRTL
jgi:putative membrane-bound dehydrogenase-like protein